MGPWSPHDESAPRSPKTLQEALDYEHEDYKKAPDLYARGGMVEPVPENHNEEIEMAGMPNARVKDQTESSEENSDDEEDLPRKSMSLDLVGDIMMDRKRRVMMASGGMVQTNMGHDEYDADEPEGSGSDELSSAHDPAFEEGMDLEPVHTISDEAHDQQSPSLDDHDLIGQILKERKMRRRG
jgi:hypothetical protein